MTTAETPTRLSVTDGKGIETIVYEPYDYQLAYHASTSPNLLALGTRNTGKSLMLRMDAIMRCLMISDFRALILRRTMPELRKSHLFDIPREMKLLTGDSHAFIMSPNPLARFPNGSSITFAHCEDEAAILDFLSSAWGFIGFDELTTFTLTQFLQISAAARAPKDAPYQAVVRAGTNPLGPGASWVKAWFVDKNVRVEDYPDYLPDEFEMQFSKLDQNKSADVVAYTKRLKNLPAHVRKAWLEGEFGNEGAYFTDFQKTRLDETTGQRTAWHVIDTVPTWKGTPLFAHSWLAIYRAIDWGYDPDPAVCLWIACLPDKRSIVFKERSWKRTLAGDVAREIKRESDGMHIVESFCDPTMLIKEGQVYSIGEIFEQQGVPVTAGTNDRILYGYSIHDQLNTVIDGKPQLQIVQPLGLYGCPDLLRTLPELQKDKLDPRKLADGTDHWVVALAYYCMGLAVPSRDPEKPAVPRWMRPKRDARSVGSLVV